jgi:thioesterase domain-containing protein
MIRHYPDGPYAIGGYSIGGFIAVEMARQLEAMGKTVKMLVIFDTDADNVRERAPWYVIMPKIAKRYLPKFLGGKKSLGKQLKRKMDLAQKTEPEGYYILLNSLIKRFNKAMDNYKPEPVDHIIHLFKAEFNDHYNDDEVFLGWKKYTTKDVKRYVVPGNHLNMMASPNVTELGKSLQDALNNH